MEYLSGYLWFAVVAMGPLLLAGMIAYALLMRRSLNRSERLRRDEATNRLYQDRTPGAGRH
jgi:hypothetical protein